jgi:LmbE family N-acetylglucosaminyl deacetylase
MHPALRLLCVVAHPDDESIAFGGTLAKYAAEGIETYLVVATRGERGWLGKWEEYPGAKKLGAMRESEVREASQILGISQLYFLDYMDGNIDQINEAEIIAKITRLVRQIRPHVVITFGPDGLYGHPDHIAISQFTTSAIMCAADHNSASSRDLEPHSVAKLYYRVAPHAWFTRFVPVFGEMIMFIDGQERRAHPWVDWIITTRIDAAGYWRRTWQAIGCHQSQLPDQHILQQLSEEDHCHLWGQQEFYRVFSQVNGGRREEHDLFEGLRTTENAVCEAPPELVMMTLHEYRQGIVYQQAGLMQR